MFKVCVCRSLDVSVELTWLVVKNSRKAVSHFRRSVLTSTSLDESPSIAPNGTMLIYATQDRGRGILAVVSIDGSVKYRLPSTVGDVREPAWSPFLNRTRS